MKLISITFLTITFLAFSTSAASDKKIEAGQKSAPNAEGFEDDDVSSEEDQKHDVQSNNAQDLIAMEKSVPNNPPAASTSVDIQPAEGKSPVVNSRIQQGQPGSEQLIQGYRPSAYPQGRPPVIYPQQNIYPQNYPQQNGYPQNYPQQGFPQQNGYPQNYPQQGFPQQNGYPQNYPQQGGYYPQQQGYPVNVQGYPQGYPAQGRPTLYPSIPVYYPGSGISLGSLGRPSLYPAYPTASGVGGLQLVPAGGSTVGVVPTGYTKNEKAQQ